ASDVFVEVEKEVVARLERHTLIDFFNSRYYVLVDLLTGIDQMSSRTSLFGLTALWQYRQNAKKDTSFKHPMDGATGAADAKDATAAVRRRRGLPVTSVLTTLDTLVHTHGSRLTSAERDALVISHHMVSSYAEMELDPQTQGGGARNPSGSTFGPNHSESFPDLNVHRKDKGISIDRDFMLQLFSGWQGPRRHTAYEAPLPPDPEEAAMAASIANETFEAAPKADVYPIPTVPRETVWGADFNVFEEYPPQSEECTGLIAGVPRAASYMALPTLVDSAMHTLGLYDRLRISRGQMWFLSCSIQGVYNSQLTYHNATHATDMSHM
ncbi:hypothetical protein KIPB_010005, partial [Kipferlia bialata]